MKRKLLEALYIYITEVSKEDCNVGGRGGNTWGIFILRLLYY
jgi:hypothetical protein